MDLPVLPVCPQETFCGYQQQHRCVNLKQSIRAYKILFPAISKKAEDPILQSLLTKVLSPEYLVDDIHSQHNRKYYYNSTNHMSYCIQDSPPQNKIAALKKEWLWFVQFPLSSHLPGSQTLNSYSSLRVDRLCTKNPCTT